MIDRRLLDFFVSGLVALAAVVVWTTAMAWLGTTGMMMSSAVGAGSTTIPNRTAASPTVGAGDMGGQINVSSGTLTIPAISPTLFAAGMTLTVVNYSTLSVAISSTPTINNCPASIAPSGFMDFVSNGASLDCFYNDPSNTADTWWEVGKNMATTPRVFSVLRINTHTITRITCTPEVLVGGTATMDIYVAPTGTLIGSGTKVNSPSCDANSGVGVNQSLTVTNPTVPANARLGVIATGTGWSSSVGTGVITVTYQ